MRKHNKDRTVVLEKEFYLFKGIVYIVEIFDYSTGVYLHAKEEHKNKFIAYRKATNKMNKIINSYEQEKNGLDGSVITINGVNYKLTKLG